MRGALLPRSLADLMPLPIRRTVFVTESGHISHELGNRCLTQTKEWPNVSSFSFRRGSCSVGVGDNRGGLR